MVPGEEDIQGCKEMGMNQAHSLAVGSCPLYRSHPLVPYGGNKSIRMFQVRVWKAPYQSRAMGCSYCRGPRNLLGLSPPSDLCTQEEYSDYENNRNNYRADGSPLYAINSPKTDQLLLSSALHTGNYDTYANLHRLDAMHCNADGHQMGIAIAAVPPAHIKSISVQGEDVVQWQGSACILILLQLLPLHGCGHDELEREDGGSAGGTVTGR